MINALNLLWIIPVSMIFGYIVGAVLADDIHLCHDKQRGLDNWGDEYTDHLYDEDDDDHDTDDYGYEREE